MDDPRCNTCGAVLIHATIAFDPYEEWICPPCMREPRESDEVEVSE